jgi:hypothetical protein
MWHDTLYVLGAWLLLAPLLCLGYVGLLAMIDRFGTRQHSALHAFGSPPSPLQVIDLDAPRDLDA